VKSLAASKTIPSSLIIILLEQAFPMMINEIFKSIQGESTYAGQPCVFIRTTGCNLRCHWCDTAYAFYDGTEMDLDSILRQVQEYRCDLIEVTGGEPLLQKETPVLIKRLIDEGYRVLIETGGSLDIGALDPRTVVIMDLKCPGSGMTDAMRWENLTRLKPTDEIKFVIGDRPDYLWAKGVVERHALTDRHPVLFSPVFGAMEPRQLASWILEDSLKVQLQLQLHKYIWDPEARGV
jgi:7-carboxy-7-deazaguanine synthase